MEAATIPGNGAQHSIADASMDIDMDIDLGPEPDLEPEPQPILPNVTPQEASIDPLAEEAVFEKVHVRGVDELTTDDIKQFASAHFEHETPARIEWIDDTSANIIYSSTEMGLQALAALTQVSEEEDVSALPPLRLRSAKLLASHPDSVLQVRSAVKSDRKQARAHEKSRFYLMHPEHDPRERLRQELSDRRRGGDTSEGEYRRRRFDDRELRRRRDRDHDDQFDANMYDDQPQGESHSDSERGRRDRRRRGPRELFPEDDSSSGRLRNRSASPGRDTLEDADRVDTRNRFRERSPRAGRRNQGKELFPSDSSTRELFPNKPVSSYIKKELFPAKPSNHRRSDAFDAADETADLLGRRISVPFTDGGSDQRNTNVELFPDSRSGNGSRIRGMAMGDQGDAIRAAGRGMSIKGRGASVRELFPDKFNNNRNVGKELFSETLEGRGGRRRRAEDMFS
ncbi:hypothetical protein N7462_002990 [Penicillium macrosclerotiorum]|uniref:uncharacterized protein n=1 Tax=Penicillium macrosclerotiorum TaxID=303699 RepID=UPI0025483D70|nr:uncharacterized protein N7462_002990 [Penicillium macrosclerotiorum]KAJ5688598.1 hypothetical protein N7462_002990 [Penicillium macrosclerotiorum]